MSAVGKYAVHWQWGEYHPVLIESETKFFVRVIALDETGRPHPECGSERYDKPDIYGICDSYPEALERANAANAALKRHEPAIAAARAAIAKADDAMRTEVRSILTRA